jgi:hypothetical protein
MQPNFRLLAPSFAIILLLLVSSFAFGQATVTSDQDDYEPLSTAVFTGSGFTPFETVTLKVKNLSQPCNTISSDSSYFPWTVVADQNGAFVTNWTVCNCQGDSLRLKALGQTSGLIAYAYFTDANLNSLSVGAASQSVNYGTAAFVTYTVSVKATGSGSGPTNVTLDATGLPAGVSFFWSSSSTIFTAPNTLNFTGATTVDVTLTLVVQSNTNVPAVPTFTVTATSGGTTKSGTGTLTINRQPVTGSITAPDKVYDGNTSATISLRSLTGVLFSDDVSLSGGTATFADKNIGSKTVTATGLTLSGSQAGNYILSSTTATTTASITAKQLTAVFSIADKVYDGNTSAAITDRQLVGVIGNEKVTLTGGTATFSDKNVGAAKNVTITNPMSLTGTDAGNYAIGTIGASTASITFRTATINYTVSDKTYDGTTAATITAASIPSATVDALHGLIAGDVVVVDYSSAIATFASKDIDNTQPQPVSASGFILTGADGPAPGGNGNYQVNVVTVFSATANITPLSLTITYTASNKIYDGLTSATILTRTLVGVLAVDAGKVSPSQGTATFDNKNVGTGKTVTATGFTLTGAAKGNYAIVPNSATALANITPRGSTVTAQTDSRIYNGTTSSGVAPVVDPLQTGDVIGTAPAQAYDNRNVGTGKTLTASGLLINDGNGGNNYTINYIANNTGVITAKGLNVTAQTDNRVYNGTTNSTIAPVVDLLQTGDAIGTAPIQKYDTRNVGTNKILTPGGLVINDGNGGNNYSINYVTNNTGIITPRDVNVTAQTDNRVYNGTTSSGIAPVVDVLQTGDVVGTAAAQTYDNRNVGTGKTLTASGLVINDGNGGNNYNINYIGNNTGIITIRGIDVTAQTDSRVYNGTTSSAIAPVVDALQTGDEIATIPIQVYNNRNIGTGKTLTASGLTIDDGNGGNNYTINYVGNNTGIITARGINVTAQTDSRVYNGTANSTVVPVVDALQTGDLIGTSPTQVYNNKNAGTGKTLTASGLVINDGNGGNNYTINYVANNTGIITARSINATAQTDNRVYNGTTNSTIAPVVDLLQTGDVIGTAPIQKFDTKDVGTNKTLTPGGLVITDGNSGLNYLVQYITNTTGIITAKGITGNITVANKIYDGNTSATILTRTLTDAIVGDNVYYSGGTATFDDIPVGTGKNVGNNKPVTATGLSLTGTDKNNYTVNTSAATTANITAAGLTITADNLSPQYSDPVVYTVQYGGFVPGEGTANLGGSLTFTTTPSATTGSNPIIATGAPGTYTITPGGLTSSNYAITFNTGTLTIKKEDAKITYTGSTLVATTGTATTATLTLNATIQDITAALGDPAYDVYEGDIRKATITFNIDGIDRATVPIGLVNSGDIKTGTAVYNFADAGLGDHTIILKLNGYYTSTTSGDNQLVVEVYQATGDFITGGGYLKLTSSNGLKAGDAGTKNNFGFNIKYNKGGTNLQGTINTIVRRMEGGVLHIYQVKGNSMTSLSVNGTTLPPTAVFNGKANITDITNPSSPVSVGGNSTLQVSMTDAGEPGTFDKIGIAVFNNAGGLWFASNWDGTRTVQQTLSGGNLIVHSSSNVGTTTTARTETVATAPTPTSSLSDKFMVKVYPTISQTYFTVNVQSNKPDAVEIKIYDIIGRQVEMARGGIGEPIRIGNSLAQGLYILNISQGNDTKTIRVSKL